MLLRRTVVAACVLAVAVPLGSAAAAAPPTEDKLPVKKLPALDRSHVSKEPTFDPHAVLVRFKPDASAASADRAVKSRNAQVAGAVHGTRFVRVTTAGSAVDLVGELQKDPSVDSVSLDLRRRASAAPNDPGYVYGDQSYLSAIRMPEAWDRSRGSADQVIAVVDTGVDGAHQDLTGRVLAGYNAITNANVAANTNSDDNGHGTMVAGIAAASTNNGVGIAGAAWDARILPVKVLDANGDGFDSDIAEGITWAADHGAKIINLSLGGPGDNAALHDAVTYATNKGALVVVAAGNDGNDTVQYPAAYPEALAVAATDSTGKLTDFSSYGDWVDVAAPGWEVTSTYPNQSYATGDGTSFSAPLVSGVAALVRTNFPGITPADLLARIKANAEDSGGPQGFDPYFGAGLVNAFRAVGGKANPVLGLRSAGPNEPNDVPARATAFTSSISGQIGIEGDVDWYRYDSATQRAVNVRVTPAAYNVNWPQNFDPVVEVYNQDLKLVGAADSNDPAATEIVNLTVGVGTYYVKVRSYNGAADSRNYTVAVESATGSASPTPGTDAAWVRTTGIADFATGVALNAQPSVTFARAVDASAVRLVHGVTGQTVPATVSFDAPSNTATLTPAAALLDNTPYRLVVDGTPFTSTFRTVDTAPPAVTNLQANGATGVVSWTIPPVTDLQQVIVRAVPGTTAPGSATAGIGIYAGTGTSIVAANLIPGTAYTLQAFTKDWSGTVTAGPTVPLTVTAYRARVDFNGDGFTDVAGIDANNDIKLYTGDGTGHLAEGGAMWPTGGLWAGFKFIVAGDFNGDGKVDIAGIDANSDIKYYTGNGAGQLVGNGNAMWPTGGLWAGFKKLVAGDFNNDGKTDIAGIDANSDIKLYPGNGAGSLVGPGSAMWPTGGLWAGFKHIEAGDFNNDGKVDIAGIDANNDIKYYTGNGAGLLVGTGAAMWPTGGLWAGFKYIVAGDFNNDGNADIAGIDANSDIKVYPGNGAGSLVAPGWAMWPPGGLWNGFKHLT
ncbi:S8 family serine peptidase [Dactylosporangium matsuzakiense]|uniref:S8 family serine peptidase n=1 Tax=Dactylosporangium matsuzakiense TaxID=53360 RepID=UPI0036D22E20